MVSRSPMSVLAAVFLVACGSSNDSSIQTADASTPAPPSSGIQGAWTIIAYKAGNGASVTNPSSLVIFSTSHYSFMYSNQTDPRPPFADAGAPTDSEKLSAFNTFIANSGSYELAGDTVIVHPVISRNPNYMGGGEDRFVVRQTGDTLWLTSVAGAFRWAGGKMSSDTSTDTFQLVRAR